MLIKQHLPDDLLDRHPVGTGHRWRLLSSSNPSASPPMMSAGVAGTGSRAQGQQTGNQQGTQGAPNALRAPAPTDPSPETGPTRFHPTASYTKPRDVTTHGRPTWRKRGRREGLCVRDVTVCKLNGRWAELTIPKAGRVRFRVSRPLPPGRLGMARVTLDGKARWHVSFPGPQPALEREPTGAIVG